MTTYHMRERVVGAFAPWSDVISDCGYNGARDKRDAKSVYSGVQHITQSVGLCRTPHAINRDRKLVNGWCEACRANGAGQE